MRYEDLRSLATSKRWEELESAWLSVIAELNTEPAPLLEVIDAVVASGKEDLAGTMGWAWLSSMKEQHPPREALRLGRGLLLRLPDGEELREEILALYKQTHSDRSDLDAWVERSGLNAGKSVRRALRFLDVGLRLKKDSYLIHRTDDIAARVADADCEADEITLKEARRTRVLSLDAVIEDYDLADENDFHVLQQLNPQRIEELIEKDPITLAIGILRSHRGRIDRDELKLMLVPRYLEKGKWSDWWGRIRSGVKKSPNLRLEGRSPMFLVYDPVGRTLEQETWPAFWAATTPRGWLDVLEGYLRDTKHRKTVPDADFIKRVEQTLLDHVDRFCKHQEPHQALATALIVDRVGPRKDSRPIVGKDARCGGLPFSDRLGARACELLRTADDPVNLAGAVSDARLWPGIMSRLEQVFPESFPELFAELILHAPPGLCDTLARRVEKAGRSELLGEIVERALGDPGHFTDAMLWVWKGPDVKTDLSIPPALEMLTLILTLVGPARLSEGKAAGQTVNQMRAKVRAGLSARDYAKFRQCIKTIDSPLARTLREQIERAEGLGPSAQGDLLNILSHAFPDLYVAPQVAMWEDDSVLYFSEAGLRRLEVERDEVVNVKMRENAKAIGEAAAHGDLSENSEYKFALEERDLLRARLAKINRELTLAKLLEPEDVPTDHVSIGQRVTLQPTGGGEPVVVSIMGAGDSDLQRKVLAYQTPLAGQLLGKRPGDTLSMTLDGEESIQYRIVRIENALAKLNSVP